MSKIERLSQDVINKIAAGEVVQRPVNALKELLENSIDAGAIQVTITVKEGGLKMMQIQDDGHGMRKADLELVCERFTTSKLRKFEDLQAIRTYGFRGEALSSISQVSRVTILTRRRDSETAFKALYHSGKLQGTVTVCAGLPGTTITVEDLFSNFPIRKQSLRSASEEYAKIIDMAMKYAIHNAKIGFFVRRLTDTAMVDLRTTANSSCMENIRHVYGTAVAKECVEFCCSDVTFGFDATGCVSIGDFIKQMTFILFINNRLVECRSLKKGLETLRSQLPKNFNMFLYLSIAIDPSNVDVNVHPTKEEVRFLYEAEIIEKLLVMLEEKLETCCASRNFVISTDAGLSRIKSNPMAAAAKSSVVDSLNNAGASANVRDCMLVRTDSREQKLDKFLTAGPLPSTSNNNENVTNAATAQEPASGGNAGANFVERPCQNQASTPSTALNNMRTDLQLCSVLALQQELLTNCSAELRKLMENHSFVGCVDARYALVQFETRLLLINTQTMSEEFFYQVVIRNFGNLDSLNFSNPYSLYDLAVDGLKTLMVGGVDSEQRENLDTEAIAKQAEEVVSILAARAVMLWDYFSLRIEQNRLTAMPCLLENFLPQFETLPTTVVRLALETNWSNETDCFVSIARKLSAFYTLKPEFCSEEEEDQTGNAGWRYMIAHLLYPAMKKHLLVPESFVEQNAVRRLANLCDLYKVFERC